ncbi:cysteinyl leukotriene receptor 2 isoform X3 [Neoarius graeffei]|nr:cysteinyl leukotriene receptor 2 isoform X3 [Neoarius graeffei]XP_060775284.1 cysteinyl leukotriene receptor 2 isoform X3 [Neoarius graeffei]XP_060775285.1 cysteinyl leukotriene receptor 2 isoform X3 [Neoarius graeffei]
MSLVVKNDSLNETNCTYFKYQAYTITYTIMFPVGFLANLAALFVFLRQTTKKTVNTVFMTNLAISDVCFSLTLPFRLIYYFKKCQWDFSDWLCRLCIYSFYMNLYTSVLFLTSLSVLRYLAVVHPILNKTLVTMRRAILGCFCIWVFVAILSLPFLISGSPHVNGKISCFEVKNKTNWKRIEPLNHVGLVFGFLIPFIIILGCYGCIIQRLFSSRILQKRRQSQHWRSVYLIIVILSTFLLCFAPYHIVRTLHLRAAVSENKEQETYLLDIVVITRCMAASNCCLNPLLYYFAGENFRTSFSRASRRMTISSLNDSIRLSRYSWSQRKRLGSQRMDTAELG